MAGLLFGWLAAAWSHLRCCPCRIEMLTCQLQNALFQRESGHTYFSESIGCCTTMLLLLFSFPLNSRPAGTHGTRPGWPLLDSCPMPQTPLPRVSLSSSVGSYLHMHYTPHCHPLYRGLPSPRWVQAARFQGLPDIALPLLPVRSSCGGRRSSLGQVGLRFHYLTW